MKTRVVNLGTNEERIYTLPPKEAVVAAYEQDRGNHNTWTYGNSRAPITVGSYSIAAGDWCAMRDDVEQPGELTIAF